MPERKTVLHAAMLAGLAAFASSAASYGLFLRLGDMPAAGGAGRAAIVCGGITLALNVLATLRR